jgi:uncharacterized membrane protein HdeD (DUF308 family)
MLACYQQTVFQWPSTHSARSPPQIEALGFERTITMFKSISNSLILRGVLALIIGIIALAWPGVTILALVILFAIYAFMDAVLEGMRAFSSGKAGPVIGHLLLALLDIAAGVVALVWPSPTALVLTLVVGIWAFAGGWFEIFAAFGSGETAGTRAMFILTGLVWIVFGAVLFSRPDIGAVSLALVFGFFSIFSGVTLITRGVEIRRTGKDLRTVLPKAA